MTKVKTVGEQEHISCASTDAMKLAEKKRNAVQRTEMMLLMLEVILIMMREAMAMVVSVVCRLLLLFVFGCCSI